MVARYIFAKDRGARRPRQGNRWCSMTANLTSEDDDSTIVLHLGEILVEVSYGIEDGLVSISGASLGSEGFAGHQCFSQWQLNDWRVSIERHIRSMKEDR